MKGYPACSVRLTRERKPRLGYLDVSPTCVVEDGQLVLRLHRDGLAGECVMSFEVEQGEELCRAVREALDNGKRFSA